MARTVGKSQENNLLLAAPLSFLRRNLAFLLQREGMDIAVASDGKEAVQMVRTYRPSLIIADVDLPGISGFGVTQCIKEDPELSHLPVLLYKHAPLADFRDKAWASGAYDIIKVPFDALDIVERVRRAMLGLPAENQAAVVSVAGSLETLRTSVVGVLEGKRLLLQHPSGSLDDAAIRFPRNTPATLTFTDGTYTASQWTGSVRKVSHEGIEVSLDKLVAREQRRQFVRHSVSVPARYRLPGDFYRLATVLNLSVGGMRLGGVRGQLSVGQVIEFSLTLASTMIHVKGELRWMREERPGEFDCGISFIGLDFPNRDVLYDYLFAPPSSGAPEAPPEESRTSRIWRELETMVPQAVSASKADLATGVVQQFEGAVMLIDGVVALLEEHAIDLSDPASAQIREMVERVVREIEQMQGHSARLRSFFRQALGA